MLQKRTLTIEYGRTTEVLYVVGTQLTINLCRSAPPGAKFYSVVCSDSVRTNLCLHAVARNDKIPIGPIVCMPWPWYVDTWPLTDDSMLHVSMSHASKVQGDNKVIVQLYDKDSQKLVSAELLLTAVEISLDVDADRDGVVERNNPNKASWKWGPGGHGAVLLVNCDRDSGKRPDNEKNYIAVDEDLEDMSLMLLRIAGPEELPKDHRLVLHMSAPDAEGTRVFTKEEDSYPLVLNSGKLIREIKYTKETTFYVEGVKFADEDFSGLIRINVSLLQPGVPETPIFTDTVQFKITPWIMTPNVQAPLKVFVSRISSNAKFIEGIKKLVNKVGCDLQIVSEKIDLGDRWMQDELEFGYIQAPHKSFPVVFDSPRDRELDNFPYNELLGPDFGYVTKKPPRAEVNSLESFGNLEVSPPVTVNGKSYPLGRIIIGGAFPFQTDGRNMTKMVRNFLHAQVVQKPIILFSDWLLVGHVDEFLSFVPAPDKKGFRLLLASPHAAYKLFQGLQEAGHGQATLFEDIPGETKVTVNELLANKSLHTDNDYFQRCIDWNRDHLKKELGLDDEDIVDIPVLYKSEEKEKKAGSYYPDIVNMIVLGKNLGLPKPYGPKVNGQCAIEQEVTRLLGDLGLKCNYIDDFTTYYKEHGDVHCGSNVLRAAFKFKWWDMEM